MLLLLGSVLAALWCAAELISGAPAPLAGLVSTAGAAVVGAIAVAIPERWQLERWALPLAVLCSLAATLLALAGPGAAGLGAGLICCLLTAVVLPLPGRLRLGLLLAQGASILVLAPMPWWGVPGVGGILALAWWLGHHHDLRQVASRDREATLQHYLAGREAKLEERQAQLIRQAKWATLGRMATGVAHEIKNPLQAALLDLDSARRSGDIGLLTDVEASLRRIERTVREISRLRGSSGTNVHAYALHPLLQSSLRSAKMGFKSMHVAVGALPDVAVRCDQTLFVDVLANLLTNAQHAKERDGQVSVRVHGTVDANRVLIYVDDDGPGIPKDQLDRVFETFETTKAAGKGTGLGLPISRGKLQAMGGDLWAELGSSLGGARLVMAMALAPNDQPLATAHAQESPRARDPLPKIRRRVPPTPRPNERRIHGTLLLVDDDTQVRRALSRMLGREWHVLAASGTSAARKHARSQAIDVVLCDMHLLQEDALDVLETLAAVDPELPSRTVFMTGEPTTTRLLALAEANPERMVSKPFQARAARACLLGALRGTIPPLRSDDLETPQSVGGLDPSWTFDPPTEEIPDPKVSS